MFLKKVYPCSQQIVTKNGTSPNIGAFDCNWLIIPFGGSTPPINPVNVSNTILQTAIQSNLTVMQQYNITPPPNYGQNAGYNGNCVNNYAGDKEKEIYWFHPDHLGSSSYITGLDGEVTQNIEYFPSGETFVENHRNSNYSPYKFNGKELDAETGYYYYYGARYYNPRVSLWLNVDPLAEKFAGRSPYIYCANSPVRYVDPTGMYEIDGHFWTVYLMATLLGRKDAYTFAMYSEVPDVVMDRSGNQLNNTNTWISPYFQRRVHALTGENASIVRERAKQKVLNAEDRYHTGISLHYFGDSYAHTKMDSSNEQFSSPFGHLFTPNGGTEPDEISKRPELYRLYTYNLGQVMKQKFGVQKFVDLFTFDYVALSGGNMNQNAAVLETEVRIREGVKSYEVSGNQSNTVSTYLNARNKKYNSNIKATYSYDKKENVTKINLK